MKMLKNSKIFYRQAKTVSIPDGLAKFSYKGFRLQVLGPSSSVRSYQDSQTQQYPPIKQLPLPSNIEDLESTEKLKFSPQRNRDINGSFISSFTSPNHKTSNPVDDRIECYDCSGTISLCSSMQTNVPYPFKSKGKPTHLNMPGGQWGREEKYMSEEMNNFHQSKTTHLDVVNRGICALGMKSGNKISYIYLLGRNFQFYSSSLWPDFHCNQCKHFCTDVERKPSSVSDSKQTNVTDVPKLTPRQKLKAAIKDYGSVILIFHVGISLISLGCCYLAIASGVDLTTILKTWGVDEGAATAGTAANFVVAYAVHKAMAPGRIFITLAVAPLVVKKLRKFGYLKPPKTPK